MLTFGNKFNRTYGLFLPFKGDHMAINIFFHRSNTHIGFTSDTKISRLCRENQVITQIFRDLKQSSFASTFLEIRDVRSAGLDIRNQFYNIQEKFKEKVFYITNETIKLHKIPNPNQQKKFLESNLFVYIFSFSDYPDDFLYILAERHHIDTYLNKKLVRTCSFQISTKECQENLNTMVRNENGKIDSELINDHFEPDDSKRDLSDVFESAEKIQ